MTTPGTADPRPADEVTSPKVPAAAGGGTVAYLLTEALRAYVDVTPELERAIQALVVLGGVYLAGYLKRDPRRR